MNPHHHCQLSPCYIEHENSVDCISANPKNENEFVTGSHDKTLKLWDLAAGKSKLTLTGHGQGVWCVNYDQQGALFVSTSPEGLAKIWDPKSGKHVSDLKAHTKRVILFNINITQLFYY